MSLYTWQNWNKVYNRGNTSSKGSIYPLYTADATVYLYTADAAMHILHTKEK